MANALRGNSKRSGRDPVQEERARKVLEVLRARKSCNITRMLELTGLSYYELSKALSLLMDRGIVKERRIGRLRIIELNE